MAHPTITAAGRIAYGTLFCAVVPAGLWLWAGAAAPNIPLPALKLPTAGWALAGMGLSLIAVGALTLLLIGGGWPMNAFPPPRLVTRHLYSLISDPIYVGYVFLVGGASLVGGSASGLWLVTPLVALALTALVAGYERPDLARRFPDRIRTRPAIGIPPDEEQPPRPSERVGSGILVNGLWLIISGALHGLNSAGPTASPRLPFEWDQPVGEVTALSCASTFLLAILALPALIAPRSRGELRRFVQTALLGTFLIPWFFLVFPLAKPSLSPNGGERLPAAAFPALHFFWVCLAAGTVHRRSRKLGGLAWLGAGAIGGVSYFTGERSLAGLFGGVAAYWVLHRGSELGGAVLVGAEKIANSWREYRVGRLRLINHGLYAGLAGALGFFIAGTLAGPDQFWAVAGVAGWGLIGAGFWAQLVEGSSRLLRPFGFYGALLAVATGAPTAVIVGGNPLRLLASFAVAGPFIQALGRLRCLVQGCCHGAPCASRWGIHYRHPQSRVACLAGLAGKMVHPTPLYSLAANLLTGPFLFRLFRSNVALSLIAGLYLLLNGIARFAEEAYRGEPQTPIIFGLRLYQWLAIFSAGGGILLTTIPSPPAQVPRAGPTFGLWVGSLVFGLITGLALGADFPRSSSRFSRLT